MKEGSFRAWLRRYHPEAFLSSGKISKVWVWAHYKKWTPVIRSKAVFFLNTVKR